MVKIFGAALIVLCGVMIAYSLNKKARVTLAQTEGFIELVRYLRGEIECFSMPIPTALERCPGAVLEKCGLRRRENARTVGDLLCGCEMPDGEVRSAMEGFASDIGRGYKDEQLALCDRTVRRLETRRDALAGQLPTKQKMNGTLCLCFALAVVILLI